MTRWLGLALAGLLTFTATGAEAITIHPLLRGLLEPSRVDAPLPGPLLRPGAQASAGGQERIPLWVHTRDGGRSLEDAGLLLRGDAARIRTARWTRDELRMASLDPNVEALDPSIRCFANLDSSARETGARAVHNPTGNPPVYRGLTGVGVVLGLVDSGIDLQHEDFRDAAGNTRIFSLWDQTVASSVHPNGFTYGREWFAPRINAGSVTSPDTIGHGTHIAGVAAGDGSATGNGQAAFRYVGMAPAATLVIVKTGLTSAEVFDGVKYIFHKADSLGMPAVVNLSMGFHFGPHDGTDDLSLALAGITGRGHAVVAAAGNDTGFGIHAARVITAPDSASITFTIASYAAQPGGENDEIDFDGWYRGGTSLSFRVVTPSGASVGPVPLGDATGVNTPDGRVEIDNSLTGAINHDANVSFRIYDYVAGDPPAPGTWRIQIYGISTPAPQGNSRLEIWNYYQSLAGNFTFVQGLDNSDLVESPATGDSVIAVGAYTTRASWVALNGTTYGFVPTPTIGDITFFSSVGPRRDGVLKPDVTAPGQGIGSSLSHDIASVDSRLILRDGAHLIMQGTSMATPHVAGLVALMFDNLGPLSVRTTLARLTSTARSDDHTGSVPNPTWGYGKIDAIHATGFIVPVVLVSSEARQDGDRVRVRFLLSEDAGTAPLPVWRLDPGATERAPIGWSSGGSERTFVDSTLAAQGEYAYWLQAENNGLADWIGPVSVLFERTRALSVAAAPSPFVNRTQIRWSAPPGKVTIEIYSLAGRHIRTLASQTARSAGSIEWDGTDARGLPVPSGTYLARLVTADGRRIDRKILRVR